jgi:hypothetical protein
VLNKEAKFRAKSLAHRMVKWLLETPIEPVPDTPQLVFRTVLDNKGNVLSAGECPARIGELLYRWPRSAYPKFSDEDNKSPLQRSASTEQRLGLDSA